MVPKEGRVVVAMLATFLKWASRFRVRLAKAIGAGADQDLVLASFTECDFDGYAYIDNPLFPTPTINGDDRAETLSPLLTWTAGAGITSQTIKAVYVEMETMDASFYLLWFQRLSPSVTLAAPGEVFQRKIDILADNLVP